jgi:hypothetical protein
MIKRSGAVGLEFEELLRAYFLRAGFFVARGVPVAYNGEDLTDVDLLLYERPTGATRRIEIVDIKYKQKPKAVERLLWTRGLIDALDVDGAYVATTDSRPILREIAVKLGLVIIDGTDLQRIRESPSVLFSERLTDEGLVAQLAAIDRQRKDKRLTEGRKVILGSLANGLGAASVVNALASFSEMATLSTTAHPGSDGAEASGRLAYLAAAMACVGLDYISVGAAFRSIDERRELLLNAVRYGAADSQEGARALRLAARLIEKYAPGGSATAHQVEQRFRADLNAIPAEIVADQAGRLLKEGILFNVARDLEAGSYNRACPPFDVLNAPAKAMIGALLDFSGVSRKAFAAAWATRRGVTKQGASQATTERGNESATKQQADGSEPTAQVSLFK